MKSEKTESLKMPKSNRRTSKVSQGNGTATAGDELAAIFRHSMLWTPERLAASAWLEHVPFAFWLVDVLRPATIVELGTHTGVSYSSFCQAVKTLGLSTRCYAVDTWKGDEHAGVYGEEIYNDLLEFNGRHYSAFSRLVRSTFDDALLHFEDGTIDLLHIDGFHTYEAVRHDFESWLPKLSSNAVIILHDTNVRENNFGVFRLWSEIASGHTTFTFLHGHGLGVLGLGRVYPEPLRTFFNANLNSQLSGSIREIFSTVGRSIGLSYERSVLDQTLAERDRELGRLRDLLADRDVNMAVLTRKLVERETRVAVLDGVLAERDREQGVLRDTLASRDANITVLTGKLIEREAAHVALDQTLANRDRELSTLRVALTERDKNVAAVQSMVMALRSSTSWRVTAPIRWAKKLFGRFRNSAAGGLLQFGSPAGKVPAISLLRTIHRIAREKIYLLARHMFNRLPISKHLRGRIKARAVRWRIVQYLNPWLASSIPLLGATAFPPEFASWIKANEPSIEDWKQMTGDELAHRPLVTIIVPVYKVPSRVLAEALESIAQQSYPNWEACIAYADDAEENWKLVEKFTQGDPRFRAIRIERNRGISGNSNEALRVATGEFIGLLDHDDTIAPWALYAMVKKINETPDSDFLYSDKDCISEDGCLRINPLFKPEWSPEMLYSVNYLTHFNIMRRSIVEEVGGFRPETDGAQDWDLFFRVTERSRRVSRVIGILYHWRMIATSTAMGIAAKPYALQGQLRAIKDRIRRLALPASVEPHDECGFRIRWDPQPWEADIVVDAERADASRIDDLLMALQPERVRSVIIATSAETTRNNYPLGSARWGKRLTILQKCLQDLSCDDAPLQRALSADVLVFISSQIVRFGPEFLTELGGWCMGHSDIAFVSSLVLDLDERVVEAGALVDPHLRVAPLLSGTVLRSWGWFGGALWYRNCSAANPWAVAMRRDAFEKAGGLDLGSTWQEAFVSLCLRLRAGGRRGMVDPHSRVYVQSTGSPMAAAAPYVNDPYFHPGFTSANPLQIATLQ